MINFLKTAFYRMRLEYAYRRELKRRAAANDKDPYIYK